MAGIEVAKGEHINPSMQDIPRFSLDDLLKAINKVNVEWEKSIVSVQLYGDGSGAIKSSMFDPVFFETIAECFEILARPTHQNRR